MTKFKNLFNIEKYYEVKDQIIEFILFNQYNYDKNTLIYLVETLTTDDFLYSREHLSHHLLELFSKFGVLKKTRDFYHYFAEMLHRYDLLKGNCCEVAAGSYPRLSEIVYPTIEKNHSSLTIYDPRLAIKRLGNAKLYREEFNHTTDIDNIDTLFGLFPCAATIPMVERAIEEDKNLLVAFCKCDHSTDKYPLWVGDCWAEDFCMILKEDYGDELKILNWPSDLKIKIPIMLRESKNRR